MTTAPFVTDAVVLRTVDYGEADRVVTLYTRAHGKLAALAKGARRSRRRFGASLAPFVLGEAELRERRGGDLAWLERFEARRDFSGLGLDVVALAHASYGTELARELTVPRQADPAILDLLVELFAVTSSAGPRADTLRAFELALLGEIGLRPVLDRCLVCGAEGPALDAAGAVVDPGQGGLVCGRCAVHLRGAGARPLPPAARERLARLQGLALAPAAALAPAVPEVAVAAREAVHALLAAHLRGPLKSLDFIRQLKG